MEPKFTINFPISALHPALKAELPKWTNCSNYSPHQNYTVTACQSLSMLHSSGVSFRPYILDKYDDDDNNNKTKNGTLRDDSYYVVYQYFFDSKWYDVCNQGEINEIMAHYQISSCEQFWCSSVNGSTATFAVDDGPVTGEKDKAITRLRNYCQYCKRPDFESFHRRVANGTCHGWAEFPSSQNYCKGITKGLPLVFDRLSVSSYPMPYMCHCNGGTFAYKCDAFSLILQPIVTDVYPFFMSSVMILMALINFLFYIVPFCTIRTKNLIRNWEVISERSFRNRVSYIFYTYADTYVLITVFMEMYFLFSAAENIVQYPVSRVNRYRRFVIGDGFFRATGFVWILLALFTLCTIWMHVMRIANSISKQEVMEDHMPLDLKIVLSLIYIVFALLFAIPLFSLISAFKYNKWVNTIYFPATCISTSILAVVYATYGTKLYLKMRESRKMGLFEVKFTRFAAVVIVLLLLVDFQMVFVIIEWARKAGPTFGIIYRTINFQLLSISIFLIALSVMYQTFKSYLIYEAYPFLRCFSYDKMKRILSSTEESESLLLMGSNR